MDDRPSIADLALSVRASAANIVARRQSDGVLYAVLAGCLAICERCLLDPAQEAELRALCAAMPILPGRNRVFVERGSDVYQATMRYVFHGEENNANISRYAHSLRVAASMQIRSEDLADWLATEGGVNALYLRRPSIRDQVSTRCLRLDETITVPKDRAFTLTLKRTAENVFMVLEVNHADPS